ncbi:MAG: hypothetical protein KDK39_14420 [Leptospiraceae bacterium]|nr:hypothetical protein [Leptospiraceae bacterium]
MSKDEDFLQAYKNIAFSLQSISVSQESLVLNYKGGQSHHNSFNEIKKAAIITTDEGPFVDDVFWLLVLESIVMIPQGIEGEDQLLPRLQQLPGFHNELVIKAMSSVGNDSFEVWSRD